MILVLSLVGTIIAGYTLVGITIFDHKGKTKYSKYRKKQIDEVLMRMAVLDYDEESARQVIHYLLLENAFKWPKLLMIAKKELSEK